MRLNFISVFETVDNETIQEFHVEKDNQIMMPGRVIKFCRGCKQWVSRHDYLDYCFQGYHEFSTPIKLNASQIPSKHRD